MEKLEIRDLYMINNIQTGLVNIMQKYDDATACTFVGAINELVEAFMLGDNNYAIETNNFSIDYSKHHETKNNTKHETANECGCNCKAKKSKTISVDDFMEIIAEYLGASIDDE